jgi:hypothetical protein
LALAAGQVRALEGTHNEFGENALGLVLREPVGVVGIDAVIPAEAGIQTEPQCQGLNFESCQPLDPGLRRGDAVERARAVLPR